MNCPKCRSVNRKRTTFCERAYHMFRENPKLETKRLKRPCDIRESGDAYYAELFYQATSDLKTAVKDLKKTYKPSSKN